MLKDGKAAAFLNDLPDWSVNISRATAPLFASNPSPLRVFHMRLFLFLLLLATPLLAAEPVKLEYIPAPAGNPLKGLVPYAG